MTANRDFHPAADVFPLLEGKEFDELVNDIKMNGLREPIKLLGGKILDGRNRYRACIAAGFKPYFVQLPAVDPIKYVISANIHRRHLTAEQKRDLIGKLLKAAPEKSNRRVAKAVGVSHPHVAKVRQELEKAGDVETVTTSVDTTGRQQPAKKKAKPAPTAEVIEIATAKPNPITRAWDKADREMRYEFIRSRGEEIVGDAFDVEAGTDMPVTTAVERAVARQRGRAS